MNCQKCNNSCIKNGFQLNGKQRYICKICKYSQQKTYTYNAYMKGTNQSIVKLLVNSSGIRDISRVLSISKTTVISRILYIAKQLNWKISQETNQIYEVDELYAKVKGMNRCWLTYAINRKTKQVIAFSVGSNNKEKLGKVVNTVLFLNPKKVFTDKLTTYKNLIPSSIHSNRKYQTNTIERFNLNLRTHLKRLSRRTICYSKSIIMLEAVISIYFYVFNSRYYNRTRLLNFKTIEDV